MARTPLEIKNVITANFISRPQIIAKYGLVPGQTFDQQFSTASFESILFDCIANDMAIHEQLVEANALLSKYSTVAWYKNSAMTFLDGLPLLWIDNHYTYDLTNVIDVDARKIITRCAVLPSNGRLVIKVATDVAGVTQQLTTAQKARFVNYMELIKEAGDNITYVNDPGDDLRLSITVQVDVSQIDLQTGKLLSTSGNVYPIQESINNYLTNLQFNGALVRNYLIDALQSAVGVKNIRIDNLQSKFGAFSFTEIGDSRIPNAGYFVINPVDLTINYTGNEL